MTSTTIVHDQTGRVIERTVDHGNGTATRTTWPAADADPVVETITVPVPAPDQPDTTAVLAALAGLAGVDPGVLALAVGVGGRLGMAAGDLLDRLDDIAATNTTRPWAQRVTQIAVDAALAAGDPPQP